MPRIKSLYNQQVLAHKKSFPLANVDWESSFFPHQKCLNWSVNHYSNYAHPQSLLETLDYSTVLVRLQTRRRDNHWNATGCMFA